jgi:hypothetical protein
MKPSLLALAIISIAFAQQSPAPAPPPQPRNPVEMPAHDRHEGIVIAADPCLDAQKSKTLFGKKDPYDAGILALEVFIKNETPQPARVDLSTVRLEVPLPDGGSQKLESLKPREVATLIVYPAGAPNPSNGRRLPGGIVVPLHDKKVDQVSDEIRPRAFDADIIPPLATIHGYLFFNLGHDFKLATDSTLYLPDIKIIPGNKLLMFFEVALAPAITRTPAPPATPPPTSP